MTLPIHAIIDYSQSSNPAMWQEFYDSGPVGLTRKYLQPCADAGCNKLIVRMIPGVSDEWLHSWSEAISNICGPNRFVLYTNPFTITPKIVRLLDRLYVPVALEFNGQQAPDSWVRGYLHDVGLLWAVEPGIEKTDVVALEQNVPMVLSDEEWIDGYLTPDGPWSHDAQIDPKTYMGGVLRLFRGDPQDLQAWFDGQDSSYVEGCLVPADYHSAIAKITGA